MLKHNFLITFRNFQRNKTSFLINLIGLSIGLACTLLIYLWVYDEMNVDKFHKNKDNLYQVMHNYYLPQEIQTWESTPTLLANALEEDFHEIEMATNTSIQEENPSGVLSFGDKKIIAQGTFADEKFFDVFSFPILEGDKKQILKDKNNIVISDELAKKLFKSKNAAVGEFISWETRQGEKKFFISGIFKSPPANSTMQFDFVWNTQLLIDDDEYAGKWNGGYAKTFLILKPDTDLQKFNERIAFFMKTKSDKVEHSQLFVRKYDDAYLYGNYKNGKLIGGRISYVRLFSLIAIFILLIACINFMNLSTARASTKLKEIGVKKTIGANRQILVAQFLGESTLMGFLSMLLALLMVEIFLPQFNEITDKSLLLGLGFNFVIVLLVVLVFTGLVAGSYPAFYLSGFKPSVILKGKRIISFGEQWVRKGLVVFQFALSVIFIVGVVVVQKQMEFIQNKNLGFNRNNMLSFERPTSSDVETFLSEVKNISGVANASYMWGDILSGTNTQGGYSWQGQESDKNYLFKSPIIGYDVIETMNIKLLQGRTFSKTHQDDYTKILINESAQKMMQLENPVGMNIGYGDTLRQIIGVVGDFNYGSIHHQIEPLIFRFSSRGNNIIVRLNQGSEKNAVTQLEQIFDKFHPAYPFKFSFLDEDYQRLYEAESRVAVLSKYFSGLAILISCLGLFGLAMFTAEKRKKEIGIRKVLGSSVFGIVKMLTNDFTKTVIFAILISLPISYFIAKNWLDNFAYNITLTWWFFLAPALIVLFIAWCTIGIQTFKAASINPVESLKDK